MIKQLSGIGEEDGPFIGKKIMALSKIQNDKKLLLPSFIITSKSFNEFINRAGIKGHLLNLFERAVKDNEVLFETSEKIQGLIMKTDFDEETGEEIEEAYHSLDINYDKTEIKDLLSTSGSPIVSVIACEVHKMPNEKSHKLPIHFNVIGLEYLESAIKHCWASQFTKESLKAHNEFNDLPSNVSVLIQKMMQPVKSIIAYSINPENGDNTEMVINAAYGLPGIFSLSNDLCDRYIIGKANLQIKKIEVKEQKYAQKADYDSDQIVNIELPKDISLKQKINDKEIWEIGQVIRRVSRDISQEIQMEFLDDTQRRFISNVEILDVPYVDIEKRVPEEFMLKDKKIEKLDLAKIDGQADLGKSPESDVFKEHEEEFQEAGLAKAKELEQNRWQIPPADLDEDKGISKVQDVEIIHEDIEKTNKRVKDDSANKFILSVLPKIKEMVSKLPEDDKNAYEWTILQIESGITVSYEDFLKLVVLLKEELFNC